MTFDVDFTGFVAAESFGLEIYYWNFKIYKFQKKNIARMICQHVCRAYEKIYA